MKGPSGWLETYSRKLADKALVDFLAPLEVREVVASFRASIELETHEETWPDVMNYLAKMTDQAARGIPEIIGVAFWAHAILHEQEEGAN